MPTYDTKKIWNEIKHHKDFCFCGANVFYDGTKNTRKMHYLAKKAYSIWLGQRRRCNISTCKEYKYYGAKGVKCLWSSGDCVDFYLTEFFKRPYWIKPCISRLEDKGNYRISNVRLLEVSENSSEIKISQKRIKASKRNALKANKAHWVPIVLINTSNSHNIRMFNNSREADRKLGLRPHAISDAYKRNRTINYNGQYYTVYRLK